MMKRYMKIGMISISLAVLNLLGCSDVKFRSTPQNELIANCTANDVSATVGNRCVLGNDLRIGSVDILFINDNSGSMSFEQKRMSESFNSLISTLDGQNIDYNIAVTTTDISTTNNPADDENGNGALQDGKFIQFPNGEYILRKSNTTSSQRVQYFGSVIEREETKTCEDSGFTTCPSGDERGIYALNKVLDRADSSFFQSNLFAVVILSDEDERSDGGRSNSVARQLEEMDQPESVVSRLGTSLGLDKSMTVYSFIVQPGDYTCKSQQDAQGVALGNNSIEGNYGVQYGLLSNPSDELKSLGNIIEGKTISICGDNSSSTPDFGSELDDIGRRISVDSLNVQLPCEPELPEVGLEEGFDPIEILVTTPGGVELTDLGYTVDENNILRFTDIIEAGSEIQYSIVCKRITSL